MTVIEYRTTRFHGLQRKHARCVKTLYF